MSLHFNPPYFYPLSFLELCPYIRSLIILNQKKYNNNLKCQNTCHTGIGHWNRTWTFDNCWILISKWLTKDGYKNWLTKHSRQSAFSYIYVLLKYSLHGHEYIHFIWRITQNNWIGVVYTPLEGAFNKFIVAIFVHFGYINNSCNFILYILTGSAFRKQLVETLTFCKKKKEGAA